MAEAHYVPGPSLDLRSVFSKHYNYTYLLHYKSFVLLWLYIQIIYFTHTVQYAVINIYYNTNYFIANCMIIK